MYKRKSERKSRVIWRVESPYGKYGNEPFDCVESRPLGKPHWWLQMRWTCVRKCIDFSNMIIFYKIDRNQKHSCNTFDHRLNENFKNPLLFLRKSNRKTSTNESQPFKFWFIEPHTYLASILSAQLDSSHCTTTLPSGRIVEPFRREVRVCRVRLVECFAGGILVSICFHY